MRLSEKDSSTLEDEWEAVGDAYEGLVERDSLRALTLPSNAASRAHSHVHTPIGEDGEEDEGDEGERRPVDGAEGDVCAL